MTEVRTENTRAEPGIIEEILPNQMYCVRLENGRTVRAGLAAAARHSIVRLISGSPVLVKLSPFDPNRGQIVQKA